MAEDAVLHAVPLGGAEKQQQLSNTGNWLRCKVWAQADAQKKIMMEQDENEVKKKVVWDMLVDPRGDSLRYWLFLWFMSVQ